jgi:hypothetical protein
MDKLITVVIYINGRQAKARNIISNAPLLSTSTKTLPPLVNTRRINTYIIIIILLKGISCV